MTCGCGAGVCVYVCEEGCCVGGGKKIGDCGCSPHPWCGGWEGWGGVGELTIRARAWVGWAAAGR